MSYNFSQKDVLSIFTQEETSLIFPENKGKIDMHKYFINDEIFLFKNTTIANSQVRFENDSFLHDNIHLHYQISGNAKTTCQNTKDTFLCKSNHSSFLALKECSFLQEISQGKSESLGILLSSDFVEKYFPHFKKINETKQIKSNIINPKIQSLINEIYNSPYEGNLNDLYIQSKALEIVFLEVFSMREKQVFSKIKFNEYDIQAVHHAKSYLIENYANPPSIKELSRIVKLNDFKLKYGFKLIFGITPYKFVLNFRLHKAKSLLEQGEMNVSEIAKKTGYNHVQNFSNAFYKHFGITPKSLNKNKLYYY